MLRQEDSGIMTQPAMGRQHLQYIEWLRVFTMFSVVFLHASAQTLRANLLSPGWTAVSLATSLATAAVPLFFMMSGALLLGSGQTSSIHYLVTKRLPRLVLPLAAWSCISVVKDAVLKAMETGTPDLLQMAKDLLRIPAGPVAVHFWFMYILIPLYLISPILKHLVDTLPETHARYVLGLWGAASLLGSLRLFLRPSLAPALTFAVLDNLLFLGGHLGYFLLGHYLAKYKRRIPSKWLWLTAAGSFLLIAAGTAWKTGMLGTYSEQFKAYPSIYVLILSAAVFLLFRNGTGSIPEDGGKTDSYEIKPEDGGNTRHFGRNLASWLGSLSFGVYLMHNILLSVLAKQGLPVIGGWNTLRNFLLVSIVCMAAITVLSSIPFLCYIFTGLTFRQASSTCNLVFLWKLATGRHHSGKR